ncbi:2-isopropylmalate synthase [Marinobacter salsuginis]|uniref:2-isopropylmalate synthase n=1 Tax=Marinobacter salsuginis TaxID=418719 RepID=UPI001D189954|nr:2-isopropylmalate synthase [Marinobacter salsuginis]
MYPEESAAPEIAPGQPEPVARRASGSVRVGTEKPAAPDRTEGVARIADLQALMGGKAGVPEKAPPQSPPTPSLPEAPTEAPNSKLSEQMSARPSRIPTLSANLMIWAGSNVVLIGGMSEDASGRLQETLAMNILKSLGEHKPRVLGRVIWPIFNNLLVPGNSGHDLVEVIRHILSGLERKPVVVLQAGEDSEQGWLKQLSAVMRQFGFRTPSRRLPVTRRSSDPCGNKYGLWSPVNALSGSLPKSSQRRSAHASSGA